MSIWWKERSCRTHGPRLTSSLVADRFRTGGGFNQLDVRTDGDLPVTSNFLTTVTSSSLRRTMRETDLSVMA